MSTESCGRFTTVRLSLEILQSGLGRERRVGISALTSLPITQLIALLRID